MNALVPPVDLTAFRAHVSTWLGAHYRLRDPGLDDDRVDIISRTPLGHQTLVDRARSMQHQLWQAGLAGVAVPEVYGGLGLTEAHAAALDAELVRFDTPTLRPLAVSLMLALPTVLRAGTNEQKHRYVPPILSGEELWCQLFSEPDAGSDLAALRTRATLHGDEWIVDGQKVWSSYASDAQYGLLLVRTDDKVRAQAGMTMFVLDMASRGVAVKPLVDLVGGRHFNEVFLSEVRVPIGHTLGGVNDGWRVATATLTGERSGYLGGSGDGRRRRQVEAALRGSGRSNDRVWRAGAAQVVAEERILELLSSRIASGQVAGGNPAAGSLIKLAAGNLEQRAAEVVAGIRGLSGVAWPPGDRDGDVTSHALNASRQATIAGGTHQIQRNLVAERLLGLPR